MDGILALGRAKRYADEQIALKLVSGSVDKGTWDAAANIPTLAQGVGTAGWYYHVSVPGTWEGIEFNIGDTVLFDSTQNKWVKIATGGEPEEPIVTGYVKKGDTLPAERPSGNPLVPGDSVGVKSDAVLPFTIDGITFENYSDTAVWNGTEWQKKAVAEVVTEGVGVSDSATESFGGASATQAEINIENVALFKTKLNINQDAANVGKVPVVNAAGNLEVADVTGVVATDNITVCKELNKIAVKDGGLTVPKFNSTALSLVIPVAGAVDTKITTEKAVADALAAKVDVAQGTANVGKILEVDVSGNLALVTAPQATVDNITVDRNSLQEIEVKDGGLTVAKFDPSAISTAIGSTATDTKLVTEKAVKDTIAQNVQVDNITIERPTETQKITLKDGGITVIKFNATALSTALSGTGTDFKIPTEKAVIDGLNGRVKIAQGAENAGKILKVDAAGNLVLSSSSGQVLVDDITINQNTAQELEVKDGGLTVPKFNPLAISTVIAAAGVASDSKLATEKAVRDVLEGSITADNITIDYNTASHKLQVKDGGLTVLKFNALAISTTLAPEATAVDSKFPTEKAVVLGLKGKVNVAQGTENVGKILKVDENGNLVLANPAEDVTFDDITIDKNADGQLEVKDAGITYSKLNSALLSTEIAAAASDEKVPTELAVANGLDKKVDIAQGTANKDKFLKVNDEGNLELTTLTDNIRLDDVTVEYDTDNKIAVKNGGLTVIKFNDNAVSTTLAPTTTATDTKITTEKAVAVGLDKKVNIAQGTENENKFLKVNADGNLELTVLTDNIDVDDVTVEYNTDTKLAVKDGGLTVAKFNTEAVSTTLAPAATAVDTKVTTEKAVVTELDKKVNIAQGTDNKDKLLQVNETGDLALVDVPSVVAVDNVTIDRNAENKLEIKNLGITFGKLNTEMVSTSIDLTAGSNVKVPTELAVATELNTKVNIAQGADNKDKFLKVNADGDLELTDLTSNVRVDDITIALNADNKLEVKDGGLKVIKFDTSAISLAISDTSTDSELPTAKATNTAVSATGHKLTITRSTEPSEHKYTFALLDKNNNELSTALLDLPLEAIKIVSLEYDSETEAIVMKWQDAAGVIHTLSIPASSIMKGIVTETASQTLTNKTIDADDNDISNLTTANFAPDVIVGEVTSTSTDNQIPSAKAVNDLVTNSTKLDEITVHKNAAEEIEVKDGGLTVAKFNADAVATVLTATPGAVNTKIATEKAVVDGLDKKVDIAQGTDNKGKILKVNTEGNLALVDDLKMAIAHVDTKTSGEVNFVEGNTVVKQWLDDGYSVTLYITSEKRYYQMATYVPSTRKATWLIPADDMNHATQLLYLQCYWNGDGSIATMGYFTDNVVYTGDVKGLDASKFVQTLNQVGRPVVQRIESSDGVYKQAHVYRAVSDGATGYVWQDAYTQTFEMSGTMALGDTDLVVTIPDGGKYLNTIFKDASGNQVLLDIIHTSETSIKYHAGKPLPKAITCLTYYTL